MSTTASTAAPATEATAGDSYPELTSPTDSVIAGDFGAMSAAEQESQRAQWKEELTRTEEEIATLRQVLVAKEATAAGLKRRLGKLRANLVLVAYSSVMRMRINITLQV